MHPSRRRSVYAAPMYALQWTEQTVRLSEVPVPDAGPGEVLIRVRMAGICNTDLEIIRGYMGFSGTLGHEFAGEVADGRPSLQGRRVVGEINVGCGACAACREGLERHCSERSVLGILGRAGCFAEYVILPEKNLHLIPDTISDQAACFIEPTAAAFEILEQLRPDGHERVLVIGDGKLGLLIAQVLQQHGLCTTVLGRHAHKLARAQAFGMPVLLAAPDDRFEIVVEATGSQAGLSQAIALTRPQGTLVLKSTYHGAVTVDMSPLVIDEITLVGSRCGPFAPAIAAIAGGRVDPLPLVDATRPLSEGAQALAQANTRGTLKVLLDMQGGR